MDLTIKYKDHLDEPIAMDVNYRKIIYLSLCYLFSMISLVMFWLMATNKYEWMLKNDPSLTLPVDPKQNIKTAIFGVPLFLAAGLTMYFSFLRFKTPAKVISTVYAAVILLLLGIRISGH